MKSIIRTFAMLWLFLPCIVSAQIQDIFMSGAVIFKMKNEYRKYCHERAINYSKFQEVANQLGITKLEKIFPDKKQPLKDNAVDLSLIYELHYSGNYSEQEVIRLLNKLHITEYVELYILPQLAYTPNDTDAVNM